MKMNLSSKGRMGKSKSYFTYLKVKCRALSSEKIPLNVTAARKRKDLVVVKQIIKRKVKLAMITVQSSILAKKRVIGSANILAKAGKM